MAIEGYTETANVLRLVARIEANDAYQFNRQKKRELRKHLRNATENSRKQFTFALLNAGTNF